MPVDFYGQNNPKLRLGRGVKGGNAALPPLGGSSSALAPAKQPRVLPTPQAQVPIARNMIPGGGPGYPIDLTPPGRKAAPQYAGAALLRRMPNQIFPGLLPQPAAGKGVKQAANLLRDPDKLFKPKNKKQLDLITHPGPVIQAVIDADPVLKRNQAGLTQHLITKGPVKLPAQDMIKKLNATYGAGKMNLPDFLQKNAKQLAGMSDEDKARFSAAVDKATQASRVKNVSQGKVMQAGVAPPIQRVLDTGLWQNAINQGLGMATGIVPTVQHLVTTDPRKSVPEVYHATVDPFTPAFHGDFGKVGHNLYEQPLTLPLTLGAFASAGLGTAGRLSALTEATAARSAAVATEDLGGGAMRVGGRFTTHPHPNGRHMVRDSQTNKIVGNFPDQVTAVEHAKSLGFEGAHRGAFTNALHAYTHPEMYGKTRGAFVDILQKHSKVAKQRFDDETTALIAELKPMIDDPNLRTKSGVFNKESRAQAKADVKATASEIKGAAKSGDLAKLSGHAYRELVSGIRHGAIYARPAYLPNNWAGNTFMNMTHQGVLAPVNLAKSVFTVKNMNETNLAMMRKATGMTPAESISSVSPRGIVTSGMRPLVETMSKAADQPFRDAAFLHEARRAGFRKVSQVDKLFDTARAGGEAGDAALAKIASIGVKAQEEVVKFKNLSPGERQLAQNGLFVWNWVRGAGRYTARFPLQHPIQAAGIAATSPIGNRDVARKTGGMPWFMAGSIPVGRKSNGDPIMINPFALNPLGSGMQAAQIGVGTYKSWFKPNEFNKFTDPTWIDLLNPLLQEAIKRAKGERAHPLIDQVAPVKLIKDLMHPGRGSTYPMSRTEAVGHYFGGSLYPRRASQEAITSSLERELQADPIAYMSTQAADYEKATGTKLPPALLAAVKGDIDTVEHIKDFQRKYADSHGSVGFRKMAGQDRLKAGIQYLEQHHILPPSDIADYKAAAETPGIDEATMAKLANAAWGATGAGQYKRKWDEMMSAQKKTKLRPSHG